MNKQIALQQTKTSPGVRFGYISSIMSWQGAEYVNQTFDDELNFELYELDCIYETSEEENKDV